MLNSSRELATAAHPARSPWPWREPTRRIADPPSEARIRAAISARPAHAPRGPVFTCSNPVTTMPPAWRCRACLERPPAAASRPAPAGRIGLRLQRPGEQALGDRLRQRLGVGGDPGPRPAVRCRCPARSCRPVRRRNGPAAPAGRRRWRGICAPDRPLASCSPPRLRSRRCWAALRLMPLPSPPRRCPRPAPRLPRGSTQPHHDAGVRDDRLGVFLEMPVPSQDALHVEALALLRNRRSRAGRRPSSRRGPPGSSSFSPKATSICGVTPGTSATSSSRASSRRLASASRFAASSRRGRGAGSAPVSLVDAVDRGGSCGST